MLSLSRGFAPVCALCLSEGHESVVESRPQVASLLTEPRALLIRCSMWRVGFVESVHARELLFLAAGVIFGLRPHNRDDVVIIGRILKHQKPPQQHQYRPPQLDKVHQRLGDGRADWHYQAHHTGHGHGALAKACALLTTTGAPALTILRSQILGRLAQTER